MKTRIRTASLALAVLAIGLSAATAGCGKYSIRNLKAMKAFKEANDHYRGQRWREAAERYEAVIAAEPNTEAAPDFLAAYFFLGNSYDNLCKPARKGEPENDAFMTKAIENYTKAAELSKDPLIKRRAHGIHRRRVCPRQAQRPRPGRADHSEDDCRGSERAGRLFPADRRFTRTPAATRRPSRPCSRPGTPSRTTRRSGTASRLLQPSGRVRQDDGGLRQGRRARPEQSAGLPPDRQPTTRTRLQKDFRLTPAQKKDYVIKGLAAEDKALQLNPNYMEALSTRTSCSASRRTSKRTRRSRRS